MADIGADLWGWSSNEANNDPAGSTAVGTGLAPNLRAIQAAVRAALEPLTSVAGINTITASMAGLAAYVSGLLVTFVPANTNTGATTLNINSFGAKNIYSANSACVGGELVASVPVVVYYDGTQFQIVSSRPQIDTAPIVVGGTDATKKVRLEVDGLTTATTRVVTVSDRSFTIGKLPTTQIFTSGSGTYTTPTGATYLRVRMVGGGGGGRGSGTSPGSPGTGGNTTFSTYTAGGGSAGATTAGGGGGSASSADININGGDGSGGSSIANDAGGAGGNSAFGGGGKAGGGGSGNTTGGAGKTNSGGGGGGAGAAGTASPGGGGGAGAYCEAFISSPSATYSYAVGGAGTAGSAGTGGDAGGAGGSGIIIVEEFYA